MRNDSDWAEDHGELPRRSRRQFEAEEAFEKLLAEHEEDCFVWRTRNLEDCDCPLSYLDWAEENPPRQSKTAKPKMVVDGAGTKMLSKLDGTSKK